MKKIGLMLLVIMHSNYFYSMELKTFYLCNETKINLRQGSHYDVDGIVDIIVFEKNEQQFLEESFADQWLVGCTSSFKRKWVRIYCDENKNIFDKCLKSRSIGVIEPLIFISQYSGNYYYAEKKCEKNKKNIFGIKYFGDEALKMASKDLGLCYNKVLTAGLRVSLNKKDLYPSLRSIAFPTIGTARGFSKVEAAIIAIFTILEFIKNHPKTYSCIELFVKTSFEFTFYEKLLNDLIVCKNV
jgi:hypothetical protein